MSIFTSSEFEDLALDVVIASVLTSFSNAKESDYAQADVPFLLEDALRAEGAEYSSVDVWQEKVVVDGKLMTGQNPASGGPLAKAIVAALR